MVYERLLSFLVRSQHFEVEFSDLDVLIDLGLLRENRKLMVKKRMQFAEREREMLNFEGIETSWLVVDP